MRSMKRKKWWSGKRLAHIFDDEWNTGTFQRVEKLQDELHYIIYYKDLNLKYTHSLLIEEHGVTKSWVVIKPKKRSR